MVAGITLITLLVSFQTTRTDHEQKRKSKQSPALRAENDGLKSLSRCTNIHLLHPETPSTLNRLFIWGHTAIYICG